MNTEVLERLYWMVPLFTSIIFVFLWIIGFVTTIFSGAEKTLKDSIDNWVNSIKCMRYVNIVKGYCAEQIIHYIHAGTGKPAGTGSEKHEYFISIPNNNRVVVFRRNSAYHSYSTTAFLFERGNNESEFNQKEIKISLMGNTTEYIHLFLYSKLTKKLSKVKLEEVDNSEVSDLIGNTSNKFLTKARRDQILNDLL